MKKILLTATLTVLTLLGTTPSAQATVGWRDRVLVIVTELDTVVPKELKPFYSAIEELTKTTAQTVLGSEYSHIEVLASSDATFENFKQTLKRLALDPHVLAIDVIFSLHGSPGKVAFYNATWPTSLMESQLLLSSNRIEKLAVINMKRKLRMLYNLSCYGATHRTNFINMGFDSVNGSVAINANSEVEFVPAILAWRNGIEFKSSFDASNNDFALLASDGPIRLAGQAANNTLKDTNSKKLFSGDVHVKITTDAK